MLRRGLSGISLLLDLVGFREALEGASLVVIGEGALEVKSLRGKAMMDGSLSVTLG
jgi:glycerate kinase